MLYIESTSCTETKHEKHLNTPSAPTRRPRVFFLSYYPPTPTMGGAMAYYRHFVERDDFDLYIATDDRRVEDYDLGPNVLVFEDPPLLRRLLRTRFSRFAHSYRQISAGRTVPPAVLRAARAFNPDVIFTIAGSWGWTVPMAAALADTLKKPLVGSFNDWFDYSIIIHPLLRPYLERLFRNFYRRCDLALCTCEGMRDALGKHNNAVVLYPCGANLPPAPGEVADRQDTFRVSFGGNLGLWYGEMIGHLLDACHTSFPQLQVQIFGGNPSWTMQQENEYRQRGVYRGMVPFDTLRTEMMNGDCLLLTMGFGDAAAAVERTSFKTKFLDYLTMGRPIAVWGPDYCSAVTVAREFDAAEVCTSPNAEDAAAMLQNLHRSPTRQRELIRNAAAMYADRFHPDRIHQTLVNAMSSLIQLHGRSDAS